MSTPIIDYDTDHYCDEKPCQGVRMIISPRCRDLGGFTVNRLLPFAKQRMVGPWVFFDHMGPVIFEPGRGIDVRPHPHINLATVTYLFEGAMLHRDSLGSQQVIRPGDINLMVAGKGVVHSERTPGEERKRGQCMEGLQLWCALPEADEEMDPAFFHYPAAEIPSTDECGVVVRVLMGSAYGLTSPVQCYARTLYVEMTFEAGQSICLPSEEVLGLYVVEGAVESMGQVIQTHHMAVFDQGVPIHVVATQAARLVVLGGESLGERHVFWNFISSRKARIEQAKADWQSGRFPVIDGDQEEFIPLP